MFCAKKKKMPHKFCNNILLHPTKKGISYHLFYHIIIGWFFLNIIIVQVRYITIVTKEAVSIGYNRFLFLHSYSGEGLGTMYLCLHPWYYAPLPSSLVLCTSAFILGTTHLCLHPSTYAKKETRYIQYGQLLLFQ